MTDCTNWKPPRLLLENTQNGIGEYILTMIPNIVIMVNTKSLYNYTFDEYKKGDAKMASYECINCTRGRMYFDEVSSRYKCNKCGFYAWQEEAATGISLDRIPGEYGVSEARDPDDRVIKCPKCGWDVLLVPNRDQMICENCEHILTDKEYNAILEEWENS